MATTPLEGLIDAMAGAVVEAQARIEQAQIAHLADYFDEDNRPKSVVIRLPCMAAGAGDGDEDLYRAPLLPLVPTTALKIRDVEISFDAELGDCFESEQPVEEDAPEIDTGRWNLLSKWRKRSVALDTQTQKSPAESGKVYVKLRVEGVELPDGLARLSNHLAMTQGVFKTFRPGD
jgi:hypothetical protein